MKFGGDSAGQHQWQETSLLKALLYDLQWFLFWVSCGALTMAAGAGWFAFFQWVIQWLSY